jgi:hypothetical protein
MKIVPPRAASESYDFAVREMLSQVQENGSYDKLKSRLQKRGAASFLYRYSRSLAGIAVTYPHDFSSELRSEISDFLFFRLQVYCHFMITSWDMLKDTCTVMLWTGGHKMTPGRMRELGKKPLLPTELV